MTELRRDRNREGTTRDQNHYGLSREPALIMIKGQHEYELEPSLVRAVEDEMEGLGCNTLFEAVHKLICIGLGVRAFENEGEDEDRWNKLVLDIREDIQQSKS